jgi:DNA-binding CsgD family transcriptional regulator
MGTDSGDRLPVPTALDAADLRRMLSLLEECERAPDLTAFRETVVESLARFFGFGHATFFLGRTLLEVFADTAPVAGGRAARLVTQYIEEAHRHDPFGHAAVRPLYQASGVVSLDQLAGVAALRGHPDTDAYLENFLFRGGVRAKLVVPLVTDRTAGGIGLLAEEAGTFGAREMELAGMLGRHLTNLLHLHSRGLPAPPGAERERYGPRLVGAGPQEPWHGVAAHLSPRQAEVVRLLSEGLTNHQIAEALVITVDTVKKHLTRALEVTGCRNRTQLALVWRDGTTC